MFWKKKFHSSWKFMGFDISKYPIILHTGENQRLGVDNAFEKNSIKRVFISNYMKYEQVPSADSLESDKNNK